MIITLLFFHIGFIYIYKNNSFYLNFSKEILYLRGSTGHSGNPVKPLSHLFQYQLQYFTVFFRAQSRTELAHDPGRRQAGNIPCLIK